MGFSDVLSNLGSGALNGALASGEKVFQEQVGGSAQPNPAPSNTAVATVVAPTNPGSSPDTASPNPLLKLAIFQPQYRTYLYVVLGGLALLGFAWWKAKHKG